MDRTSIWRAGHSSTTFSKSRSEPFRTSSNYEICKSSRWTIRKPSLSFSKTSYNNSSKWAILSKSKFCSITSSKANSMNWTLRSGISSNLHGASQTSCSQSNQTTLNYEAVIMSRCTLRWTTMQSRGAQTIGQKFDQISLSRWVTTGETGLQSERSNDWTLETGSECPANNLRKIKTSNPR